MGYLSNVAARNLRFANRNKGMLVLSIVTSNGAALNLVSHIFEALQQRIRDRASAHQYMINLSTFKTGRLRDLPALLDGSLFNGAIFNYTLPANDRLLETTVLPFPSLVIGREIEGYAYFVPSLNTGLIADHMLQESGAKRPVMLFEPALTQATERRVWQFCEVFEGEFAIKPRRLEAPTSSEAAARDAGDSFLAQKGRIDALFAVHDNLAAGAFSSLRARHLDILGQVKVVGMGDSEWPEYLTPSLSGAGAEESRVYDQAAAMILEVCETGRSTAETIYTHAKAVHRESTKPA